MDGYMSAWEYVVRAGEGITPVPFVYIAHKTLKPGLNKYRAPGHHGDRKFYMIAPNICGSAVYSFVVSAGWQQTINAFSPAEVQFNIAEREQ
jgi:hypothetical protein